MKSSRRKEARAIISGRSRATLLRREWLEIWSPKPVVFFGAHQFKVGTSLTVSSDRGEFSYSPVQLRNSIGQLLETIDFANQAPYKRTDLEFTGYFQDH